MRISRRWLVDVAAEGPDTRDGTQDSAAGDGEPPRPPAYQSKLVKLFGPGDQPEVCGRLKPMLTPARYDAVKALIEAGDAGLTKDQLDKKSVPKNG